MNDMYMQLQIHKRMQKIRKLASSITTDNRDDVCDYIINELEFYAYVRNRNVIDGDMYDDMFYELVHALKKQGDLKYSKKSPKLYCEIKQFYKTIKAEKKEELKW